jgi:hypothetical protein
MEEVQTEQAQQPVGLTLQDMKILAGAIEIASQRGGYRAAEMEVIGSTYNKLTSFLKATEPAPVAEVTADAAAE